MKPRGKFTIKKGKFRSGLPCWKVTGTTLGGDRVREKFETEAQAKNRCEELKADADNERQAFSPEKFKRAEAATLMAEAESLDLLKLVREAIAATRKLKPTGLTLESAADYAVLNYRPADKERTVKASFDEFIQKKQESNRRERTIENLKVRLARLVAKHGDSGDAWRG